MAASYVEDSGYLYLFNLLQKMGGLNVPLFHEARGTLLGSGIERKPGGLKTGGLRGRCRVSGGFV